MVAGDDFTSNATLALAMGASVAVGVLISWTQMAPQQTRSKRSKRSSRSRRRKHRARIDSESESSSDEEEVGKKNEQDFSLNRPTPRNNPTAPTPRSSSNPKDDPTAPGILMMEGFSMEDAREHAELHAAKAEAKLPSAVLEDLQRGNARFWMGISSKRSKEDGEFKRRALIMQQYPSCAILGCSDSRVPIEIVFDQGLGDLFVTRVAGNVLDLTTTASMEYAVHHLKVKVLVVMGHEGCGAIKAANQTYKDIDKEPADLADMLRMIKGGLDEGRLSQVQDPRAHDREAVVTNVKRQVEKLTEDEAIMSKVRSEELIIVGAFYEISSGIVDFFYEVSQDHGVKTIHTGVQSRYDADQHTENRERTNSEFSESGNKALTPLRTDL
jgi:carbonic anhydrase